MLFTILSMNVNQKFIFGMVGFILDIDKMEYEDDVIGAGEDRGGGGDHTGGGGDHTGGGDVAAPVLLLDTRKRVLDLTASSLSSQQSLGPKESTPINSQNIFDSEEFLKEHSVETDETEPPKKITKLTKEDAYKLFKTANGAADAALEAIKTLVGGKYDDLTDADIEDLNKITDTIRRRFVHLKQAVRSKKLVLGSEKASATFVKERGGRTFLLDGTIMLIL